MKDVSRTCSPQWRRWAAPALALALLTACGEQELYKPPTAPYQVVGRLALPSQVEDVAVLGETAYLAGGQAGLHIVDISDPANPVLLKTLDTVKYAESVRAASTPSAGGVTDVAFVVEGTEGITTYDVTDPANAFSFNQGTTAVDGIGLFIEVPESPSDPYRVYLAESWKGLRIFESDPTVPGLLRYNGVFTSTVGYAEGVAVRDGFAYVADDEMGLAVVDVRTQILGAVRVVSSCDTPGNARAVAVEGSYAFLADYENGLVTMELRVEGNPAVPVPYLSGSLSLGGRCQAIVVRDGKAFIAAGDGGVHMVDVSHPESPRFLGTAITTEATGVALAKAGIVAVSDRYEGLVLLAGGGSFSDQVPPAQVLDLAAAGVDSTTVRLRWRAPGNDGLSGTATAYDIRYATDTLATAAEWEAAAQAPDEIDPSPRGTPETFDITGLLPATTYCFALEAGDASENWSRMSNAAFATTPSGNVPPALSGGHVTPEAGLAGAAFVFEVTYQDGDGDAPVEARVLVGGIPYDMTLVSGDYESGALFRASASLAVGAYEHVFSFNDGRTPTVTTPAASGPAVGELIFVMGSPNDEPGRDLDETRHTVVFTRDFWIDDHEVTQHEYEDVTKTNPSRFVGDDLPVENVAWLDAILYCNVRSAAEGYDPAYSVAGTAVTWNKQANGYRLPTEAEWEAACRAGTATAFANGALTEQGCGIDPVLDPAGWYCGNALGSTHAVKGKQGNAWDPPLFDMHGNVWEWCWDFYRADLGSSIAVDPEGSPGGSQRVVRGGSWYYFARDCRSASRAPYWPNSADDIVGFRVARTLFEE